MMRKKVTMRSVQGDAMHAIQQGESPIVVVMRTGSGKSVLFMLPAFVQVGGGLTIVVVPLKALRADMVVRCREVNIRCAVWEHGYTVDGASIVLVTPEKAVSLAFGTFISRVRQTQRLDRVVVAECHVILNDRWDFRQKLQQLGKLAFAETQMLLLTAL
jgi:superfamily II DNA helicase RecQ